MKHLRYLRYVVIHKWFVFLACCRLAREDMRFALVWRGLIHDWTKFLPDEWFPYAEFFYGVKSWLAMEDYARREGVPIPERDKIEAAFEKAWLLHQHRNDHHWQYWILQNDDGTTDALQMATNARLEMLADWDGAGRAITGKSGGTPAWYKKNHLNMRFHDVTRAFVNSRLNR